MLKEFFIHKTDNSNIHLLRSMGSSGVAFLVDFLTLILLVEFFHMHYIQGGIAGFITGTTLLYFISISWIFNSRRINNKVFEYLFFLSIGLIGGMLNILLLWVFTDKFGIYYMISRIMAASIVFLFNFSCRKLILFSKIND
ncbi:MAG: GtrA family protein [Spirochaetales bacterium]|nr:GtrA family protein [Spirochaetales bacterium]